MSFKALLFLLFFIVSSFAITGKEIITEYKKRYDSLSTMAAKFSLELDWRLKGEKEKKSGKIVIKKPEMFRMEMKGFELVSDGVNVWQYSDKNKQVIINDVADVSSSMLPSEIIFDYTKNYNVIFQKTEKVEGQLAYKVKLDNKNDQKKSNSQTYVWISKKEWLPLKIVIIDQNSNISTYIFKKIVVDKKFNDDVFIYKIPEDGEVIDMRE